MLQEVLVRLGVEAGQLGDFISIIYFYYFCNSNKLWIWRCKILSLIYVFDILALIIKLVFFPAFREIMFYNIRLGCYMTHLL